MKAIFKFTLLAISFCLLIGSYSTSALAENLATHPPLKNNLSLNFHDIPVRDLLELLAELKGINLVLSDMVTGNITLRLENVSWDQAFNTILLMQGLGRQQQDSIMFIAPPQAMLTHDLQTADLQQLRTALFHIHYAKAPDLGALLQDKTNHLLSERGNLAIDARTNSLWVNDTATHLTQIQDFLQDMDIPAQQVQIAARIVNVDEHSVEELGLKFGTTSRPTTTESNALHMDLPTTIDDIGHLTVAIARLGEGSLLEMELSALEQEGRARLISNPELITSDRQSAAIESGQEIPYQEKTSSGATSTSFKKAVLSLKVTPEISPGNKILLNLIVNQDKISALSFNGTPAISTQQVQTQILVHDGETIVLGGIYEESNSHIRERIPFWGSIPIVGALFTSQQTQAERKELLIFVTPKIVSNASAVKTMGLFQNSLKV